MKISFVPCENFFDAFSLAEGERELAEDYINEYRDAISNGALGTEIRYSYSNGCMLFRHFSEDVGYYFWPAAPLSSDADVAAAYREIAEYCRLEALPEVYIDVPGEDLPYITDGAPHARVTDIGYGDEELFAVEIYTECMLAEELPELLYDDLYFGEFCAKYVDEYEKLVTDRGLNRYFGYSMLDDIENGTGADFIAAVRREFDTGESMTYALTVFSEAGENLFVGEAALFGFDGRGGASVSFRILPEWQGQGYGRKALLGMLKIAGQIGLLRVSAEVKAENLASLGLLRSVASPLCSDEEKITFTFSIKSEKLV